MTLPQNLNIASSSSANGRLSSGDVFNFGLPVKEDKTGVIITIGLSVLLSLIVVKGLK